MSLRRFGIYVGPGIVLILLLICFLWQHVDEPWQGFQPPDDVKAAQVLLAQKMSGPGYFRSGPETKDIPFPFISSAAAVGQLDRIVKERHLDPRGKAKLEKLIDRLVEAPSSRVVGSEQVSVLRLNLALDQMPNKN